MATATLARTAISSWKKWRWLLLFPAAALLVFVVISAWFYWLTRASLPQLEGAIKIAGLHAPVTVTRDAYGVPHIKAETVEDLLFAQGYITAQDRLWQMDMSRRFAAGELAEVLGGNFVRTDREQRILSLRQIAERSAARLNSEEHHQLDAYVRGVNAYIENQQGKLPIEFRVLRYSPRPWTTVDTFLVGASMAQMLNHDLFETELTRERIVARIGPEMAAAIYPNRSWRDRLPGNSTSAPEKNLTSLWKSNRVSSRPRLNELEIVGVPQYVRNNSVNSDSIENHEPLPGSNNWVVSGTHTASGKPLLSNDMHLPHRIPNTWYEAHLTAGDFDVAGVTLPGTPFVIVGHNRRIAWGFTNLGPDVEDIFIETFNSRGEYLTPAGWKQPERRREVIRVRGGRDISFDVLTTRHGPIATELMPGETRPIALKWTAYEAEGLTFPFGNVDSARNWEEFRRAFSRFRTPGQNVVYADVDGHIGYQMTGAIPIRASGDGALPVPGQDDAHEWTGYIPYDELPHVFDPPGGILATANGRITSDSYRHFVSNEWGPPHRTERIYKLLEENSKLTPADMLEVQNDIYSDLDRLCARKFAAAVQASRTASPRARLAADLLRNWNGSFTNESAAATLVTMTRRQLMRMLLEPKLGAALARQYTWYSSSVALENLLTNTPKEWLPKGYGTYDELLAQAVEMAVSDPISPRDLNRWHRGSAFPLELQHPVFGGVPLLARWTGPGIVEQSGSALTVKQVGRRFGPSQRMTVDLADLDGSTLNIVTGESGNFLSAHYMDQWPLWYEGRTKALPFSSAAVQKAAAHTLVLEPRRQMNVAQK
jgi:penicillin amidase